MAENGELESGHRKNGDEIEAVLKAVRQIIHAVDVQSKRLARESGVTVPQFVVLKTLRELGSSVTTRTVAQNVSLSQATVTTLLDRLERQGYVIRQRSAVDRRIVHTHLTETGLARLENAPPLLQEDFIAQFSKRSDADRGRIIAVLNDVARMMGAQEFDVEPVLTTTPVPEPVG